MEHQPTLFLLPATASFPNSPLPIVLYRHILELPPLFKGGYVKQLFAKNHWANVWDSGVFTYDHYHSTSHEVLSFFKRTTSLQLGGPTGQQITVTTGDVLVNPAGVAHKNLGREHNVACIGDYPEGYDFDINTGKAGEKPGTDRRIAELPVPSYDPLYGFSQGLPRLWECRV